MGEHSHGRSDQPVLLHAVEESDVGEVEALLEQGHAVNVIDDLGWTPLHEAARLESSATCALLLRCGANVRANNVYGETPLHLAAGNEHASVLELCQLLVDHGASCAAMDEEQKTPLDIAQERGGSRPEALQLALEALLQPGAAVDPLAPTWRRPRKREGLSATAVAASMALVSLIVAVNTLDWRGVDDALTLSGSIAVLSALVLGRWCVTALVMEGGRGAGSESDVPAGPAPEAVWPLRPTRGG